MNERLNQIISKSVEMETVKKMIHKVAPSDSTVLIRGESGTGKELIARAIHHLSGRADQMFQAVNCAAINENLFESELFGHEKGSFTGAHAEKKGMFEVADRGTLFLDEIGELDIGMQAKLLRALQEREIRRVGGTRAIKIDVRVVAATNRDLRAMVADGRFRDDLYYRINVLSIDVPPLRERPDDIDELINFFLKEYSDKKPVKGFTASARQLINSYAWPGNVRQLESAIERAVLLCESDQIDVDDLPLEVREHAGLTGQSGTLTQLARDDWPLDEALRYFNFPPGLVIPKLGGESKEWLKQVVEPEVIIIDDSEVNRANYQSAIEYLQKCLTGIVVNDHWAPAVRIVTPSYLPKDKKEILKRLKACVLLVPDLDFKDDRQVWPNGYVLLGNILDACPWLSRGILWATSTEVDTELARTSYYREAYDHFSGDPTLASKARRIVNSLTTDFDFYRTYRPIPPFHDYLTIEEARWWENLALSIRGVLRRQEKALEEWLDSSRATSNHIPSSHNSQSKLSETENPVAGGMKVKEAIQLVIECLGEPPWTLDKLKNAYSEVRADYEREIKQVAQQRAFAKAFKDGLTDRLDDMARAGNLFDTNGERAERDAILMQVRRHYWFQDALPKRRGRRPNKVSSTT